MVALAAAKPRVLAAVAASSPNLPYLSRKALRVFMEGTSRALFDSVHGWSLREMRSWEMTHFELRSDTRSRPWPWNITPTRFPLRRCFHHRHPSGIVLINTQYDLRLLSSRSWGSREPHLHARRFSHPQGSQGSAIHCLILSSL